MESNILPSLSFQVIHKKPRNHVKCPLSPSLQILSASAPGCESILTLLHPTLVQSWFSPRPLALLLALEGLPASLCLPSALEATRIDPTPIVAKVFRMKPSLLPLPMSEPRSLDLPPASHSSPRSAQGCSVHRACAFTCVISSRRQPFVPPHSPPSRTLALAISLSPG